MLRLKPDFARTFLPGSSMVPRADRVMFVMARSSTTTTPQRRTSSGISSPRRRRSPRHRVRRQRMPHEGMLIKIDGSYHRWLGDEGPQFTLMLAVDDATAIVVNALFCEVENTRSYFLLMHGIPLALYADRHAVFKHTAPREVPAGPTQFSRAMDELGVQLIFARSPRAKGRVDASWGHSRTGWLRS